MSDASSAACTDQEAALEPLVAAACPEVDSKEVAFWLLISELEGCDLHVRNNMCGFDTSAAVSARDQAAVERVSMKEALQISKPPTLSAVFGEALSAHPTASCVLI
jgi:hypothetical protein